MRLLVTGGAGYIGSITAARLVDDGHDVTVLDDLRNGHRELVPEGAVLVEADVGEPGTYAHLLADIDACLHFAAYAEAGISMERPEAFYANNTAVTIRLLEALLQAGVGRFVLSSTCAVYGQPGTDVIAEEAPTVPLNAYGHSKLLVEQALSWLHDLRGLRYASLRYFNAAGATAARGEDHSVETHLIPRVLEVAAGRRDAVKVYGTDHPTHDGTCVRDYVHVDDLADAHARALAVLEDRETVVANLGTGTGVSVADIIATARRVTGRPIPAVTAAPRPGDPATLVAAAERAREILGWSPARSGIEEIVDSAWQWHRSRWGTGR